MTLQTQKIPINEVLQYYVDQYMIPENMQVQEYFLDAFTCQLVVIFKEKDGE